MEYMANIQVVIYKKRHDLNDKGSAYIYVERSGKQSLTHMSARNIIENIVIVYQEHVRAYVPLSIIRQYPT